MMPKETPLLFKKSNIVNSYKPSELMKAFKNFCISCLLPTELKKSFK